MNEEDQVKRKSRFAYLYANAQDWWFSAFSREYRDVVYRAKNGLGSGQVTEADRKRLKIYQISRYRHITKDLSDKLQSDQVLNRLRKKTAKVLHYSSMSIDGGESKVHIGVHKNSGELQLAYETYKGYPDWRTSSKLENAVKSLANGGTLELKLNVETYDPSYGGIDLGLDSDIQKGFKEKVEKAIGILMAGNRIIRENLPKLSDVELSEEFIKSQKPVMVESEFLQDLFPEINMDFKHYPFKVASVDDEMVVLENTIKMGSGISDNQIILSLKDYNSFQQKNAIKAFGVIPEYNVELTLNREKQIGLRYMGADTLLKDFMTDEKYASSVKEGINAAIKNRNYLVTDGGTTIKTANQTLNFMVDARSGMIFFNMQNEGKKPTPFKPLTEESYRHLHKQLKTLSLDSKLEKMAAKNKLTLEKSERKVRRLNL